MFPIRLIVLLASSLMIPLFAAEPAALVTLASVGDRVRSQNPELEAARLRISEAVGRLRQSGRLENPALETSLDQDTRFREGMLELGLSQKFPVTDRLRIEKGISATELQAAKA